MSVTSGTIKRAKPRVEVLRGYNPQEPHTNTASLPVKANVVIVSGQVISKAYNVAGFEEWELGCVKGRTPYISLQDSVDEDVLGSGKLTGLSCAGEFEIQTAFYKTGDTFNSDVPVTFDGVTGDLKATTYATAADDIAGVITRIHGPKSIKGTNSGATALNVIVFRTHWVPSRT